MVKLPSLKKIITADYNARVSFLSAVGIWVLYFFLVYLHKDDMQRFAGLDVYAALTVIALVVLGWRIWVIRQAFGSGLEITGKLNHIFFYRDIGDLKVSYTYQGERYASENKVTRSQQALALKAGQLVVLAVDKKHPGRAFVRDLYLS